jgi:hypothetical protein
VRCLATMPGSKSSASDSGVVSALRLVMVESCHGV